MLRFHQRSRSLRLSKSWTAKSRLRAFSAAARLSPDRVRLRDRFGEAKSPAPLPLLQLRAQLVAFLAPLPQCPVLTAEGADRHCDRQPEDELEQDDHGPPS